MILFVSHSAQMYGAERSLLDLVTGLSERGVACNVLVPEEGPLTEALQAAGIPWRVAEYPWWVARRRKPLSVLRRTIANFRVLFRLKRMFRERPPALIYTNTVVIPIGALLARALRVPHVWHAREFVHEDIGACYDYGTRLSMRFIRTSTRRVICNSQAVADKLSRHIPARQMSVIYNGVLDDDAPQPVERPHPQGPLQLVIVGALVPHKRQDEAVRALGVLTRQGVDVHLRVVGAVPDGYGATIRQVAEAEGVGDRVQLEGYTSDPLAAFARADVALVCSRNEAFGRVVVEAMSVGTPVVATASGGVSEIITDGEDGLLYPPGDVEALAGCITRLAREPELYRNISRQAAQSAPRRFSRRRYVEEVLALIRSVASPGQVGVKVPDPSVLSGGNSRRE